MNGKRILFAGLVAGLAMNVLDFITNALIFGSNWKEAYDALHLPETPAIPIFWITFDFVGGVIIAFLYGAMRPRFGPGPKTAILAGLIDWALVHFTLFSHFADHVFPPAALAGTATLELVSAIVGGLVAGRLYQETGERAAAIPLV